MSPLIAVTASTERFLRFASKETEVAKKLTITVRLITQGCDQRLTGIDKLYEVTIVNNSNERCHATCMERIVVTKGLD